jgi:Na+-transporting methylmalonyl-CoA/oxaloacetate decarboxylase gamma subunit
MGSGDPMFVRSVRLAALATSAAGVLLLAGCSAGDQSASAPPPSSDYRADASTPELMGAAPPPNASQAQDGLLGGPAAVGDTSTQARADAGVRSRPLPPPPARNSHLRTWRRPDGTLVTAMRPIANPKGSRYVATAQPHRVHATIPAHAAPVYSAAQSHPAKPVVVANVKPVTPKTVAPAPAPVKAATPIKPATPLVKPPVVAIAKPVAAPVPAKPTTKLEKLQAAVAPEATNGAVLAAGESLAKNQPGQVTLSLPATLGDLIKTEAAKLGLTKAAKKTSAYAQLQGDGYEITPNGRQTAVVKPGEPTTFAWQVKPGPEAKGQLKSEFGVALNGGKTPQGFSLGEISKRVAALPEKVKKGFGQFDMGALNGDISLPGLGSVPMKTALGVALVLLALIILIGVSRSASASRRKAERQRKYRTLTDYGRNEMEFEAPASAHVSYVNPFVAAAGGAAVGAVAASAMSHHDDHHGHDDHGHAAQGHDDHGHAAPGHDDHGHGHDLHAEAHPEPHAPAEHVSYVNPMLAAASEPHAHDDHGHVAPAPTDAHHAKEPEHAH